MSSNTPPNPYFSGINFNPSFFIGAISQYLTEAIANTKYLLLSGANFMTGNLGIGRAPAVELDVDGKAFINNNVSGLPTVGLYGGNSTRLILFPGTATDYPLSLGVDNTVLWYGTQTAGSHIFYTGATERLRIKSDGNVGIGTNNPFNKLDVYGNNCKFAIRAENEDQQATLYYGTSLLAANVYKTAIIAEGITNYSRAKLHFCLNDDSDNITNATIANARMTILRDGKVGIANTAPGNILQVGDGSRLRISNGTTDYTLIGTKDIDDGNNAKIVISGYQRGGRNGVIDYVSTTANGFHTFYTNGSIEKMRLTASGNLGINNTNPGNILTVGDGGRLRISNGNSDYTIIGTKDTDDVNNTKIVLSGYQRGGLTGNIDYVSTTTNGFHRFYTNNSFENLRIIQDDFQIKTSCSTYGFNYYTDGEFIPNETRTNASGTTRNGYFISCEYFFNSLVNIAASHNDITYNYWAGQVYCNNTTQAITITSMSNANCLFESFAEQFTGDYFLFFRPTVTFNASTPLRVKFYC